MVQVIHWYRYHRVFEVVETEVTGTITVVVEVEEVEVFRL